MEEGKNSRRCVTQFACACAIFIVTAFMMAGCASQEVTTPEHSATEQLLLSSAADKALARANLNIFAGRKVYLDFTYFEGYDSKYAEGEIRDAFSRAGALLAPDSKGANVIVEARAGAYSAETNSTFFGIPSIPLPIPGTAEEPVTPQVAFYEKRSETSYAKIALLAFDNQSRAHIYSSGSLDGKAYNKYTAIFFVSWWSSNVPEKAKKKVRQKYRVWFPQYDMRNMPPPTK